MLYGTGWRPTLRLLTAEELKVAKAIKHYRGIKMRWCKIVRILHVEEAEAKRLLCLYEQYQKEVINGK